MIFTMVAVAISGYLLIESAPDFSNFTLLQRSNELDDHLVELRRAVASQPACLYTTLGDLCSGSTSDEFVRNRLLRMTVAGDATLANPGTPPLGPGGSERASFLSTVPSDPYVPVLQWFSPDTGQGLFWSRSYNLVRDPTFGSTQFRESYVEDSFDLFFVRASGSRREIWKCPSLGVPVPGSALIWDPVDDICQPQVSPDGMRLAYCRRRPSSSGYEIWTANATDGQMQTRITSGSDQIYDNPLWTPAGDRVLYLNKLSHSLEVKGLSEKTTVHRFGRGLEDVAVPAWSYDGRYVAYVATLGGQRFLGIHDYQAFKARRLENGGDDLNADQVSRELDPARASFCYSKTQLPASPVTPAWSPSAHALAYVAADGKVRLIDLDNFTCSSTPQRPKDMDLPAPSGAGAVAGVRWLGRAVQSTGTTTSLAWLLVARTASPAGLFRRRLNDGSGTEYPVVDATLAPPGETLAGASSVSVSANGSRLVMTSSSGKSLYLGSTDGADRGFGRLLTVATLAGPCPLASLTGGDRLESPVLGPVRNYWVGPPATVTAVDSSQGSRFDASSWHQFLMANQDFDGDHKFGKSWTRIEPVARADGILFDNGENSFFTTRSDPTQSGPPQGSNIEPTWSPRGQTWVGREARAPLKTEYPVNLFKVPFKGASATTVRVTTGIEPAVRPDDRFLAVSQAFGHTTTFPPDRTSYPIENADLVLVNTDGSATPPPLVLTPDTPLSQEREPAWSPDGRYVYYQREVQEAPSLATHGSSIWRVTADGAVQTEVQAMFPPPALERGDFTSRIELYSPAVSPDGTRLAFIGKQRLQTAGKGWAYAGDAVSETLYVKDLVTMGTPTPLLRFAHPLHPVYNSSSYTSAGSWSLGSISWSPSGEELLLLRYQGYQRPRPEDSKQRTTYKDMRGAIRFPKQTIYEWETSLNEFPSLPFFQLDRNADGSPSIGDQELIRVLAAEPQYLPSAYRRALPNNYDVLASTKEDSPVKLTIDPIAGGIMKRRIFHPRQPPGAAVCQRILYGAPQSSSIGVSLGDVWYVLSGYVRGSEGTTDRYAGQMMLQLLDKNGLLVDQERTGTPAFQSGIIDVGASSWTRFSQALNFGSPPNGGPYTMILMLYSSGSVGSWVEFTGLKLERAFDTRKLMPTRFGVGWTLFSPDSGSDPRRPDDALFER